MKLTAVSALLAAFVLDATAPPPADACGVKLAVKYSRPRKVATRSNAPSKVLLVGAPPKRLEHDLATAGHDVEVEPNPGSAKRPTYDVVLVASNDQASEARSKWPDATVVVRSGDVTADVRSVESQVGRRPIHAEEARTVIAAGPTKEPIGAKPTATDDTSHKVVDAKPVSDTRTVVATKDTAPVETKVTPPTPTPPAPTPPAPTPVNVTTTTTKPDPEIKATPAAAQTANALHGEVFFSLGSAALGNKATLDKAVKWLNANSGVNAEIEGHADPSGTPEGNMTLSQSRADNVRDYLVSAGVDSSRLHVTAFGDTKLKYGRKDGRNRRVAIEATK